MDLSELDAFEDGLIEKQRMRVEELVKNLSDARFVEFLLQRRWYSYSFTPLYDFGIDGMVDEPAKRVLRAIRNEEYPQNKPSHREDLVADLRLVGIPLERIINSVPSVATMRNVQQEFEFLRLDEPQDSHDLKVLAFLRFAKEVLVSVEYGALWPRLQRMGLSENTSRFYWPHFTHDQKNAPLHAMRGGSHSDALGLQLVRMLSSPDKIASVKGWTQKSFELRGSLFAQFE